MIRIFTLIFLGVPLVAVAQISVQPDSPRFQEAVHVTAPPSAVGAEYNPFHTLVTMSGSTITVSVEMTAVSTGAVILPLDVVAGRFPAGSYDVSVVKRGENGVAAGTIGSTHFDVAARDTSASSPAYDFTDLWWNSSESGWGLSLTHHPSNYMFATWFVYASDGRPAWYVLPNGTWTNPITYSGAVYKTTGPYFGGSFNSANVVVTPAGTATLSFTDFSHGVFSYTIDGVTSSKNIERQPF